MFTENSSFPMDGTLLHSDIHGLNWTPNIAQATWSHDYNAVYCLSIIYKIVYSILHSVNQITMKPLMESCSMTWVWHASVHDSYRTFLHIKVDVPLWTLLIFEGWIYILSLTQVLSLLSPSKLWKWNFLPEYSQLALDIAGYTWPQPLLYFL